MCCPISLRMCETGTTSSSGPATAGWAGAVRSCRQRAAGAAAGTSAVAGAAAATATAVDRREDVLLRDASPGPGTLDTREVEAVLVGEPPHER